METCILLYSLYKADWSFDLTIVDSFAKHIAPTDLDITHPMKADQLLDSTPVHKNMLAGLGAHEPPNMPASYRPGLGSETLLGLL